MKVSVGSMPYLDWHAMSEVLAAAGVEQVQMDGLWLWPHETDPAGCGYVYAEGEVVFVVPAGGA